MSCNKPEQSYRSGSLPGPYAPLAMSYVPMQTSAAPNYESGEALARGTLFPGLDLPFMNIVNEKSPDVPTAELMAIDFAVDELELYLDTHDSDMEALKGGISDFQDDNDLVAGSSDITNKADIVLKYFRLPDI